MNDISPDAIVGIIGTLLGTILGWILGLLSQIGRIKLEFDDVNVELKEITSGCKTQNMRIQFLMRVINNKSRSFGMNSIKVYLLKNNKDRVDVGLNIFDDMSESIEFDKLLNISAKETMEIEFRCSTTILNPEDIEKYKIYIQYKFNGKKHVHKRKIFQK